MGRHERLPLDPTELRRQLSRIEADLVKYEASLTGTRSARSVSSGKERLRPEGQLQRIRLRLIEEFRLARKARTRFFEGALDAEPAWVVMLAVYDAHLRGDSEQMVISSLSRSDGGSMTTNLRWVTRLVEMGVLERERQGDDRRKVVLSLSPAATLEVEAYLDGLASQDGEDEEPQMGLPQRTRGRRWA